MKWLSVVARLWPIIRKYGVKAIPQKFRSRLFWWLWGTFFRPTLLRLVKRAGESLLKKRWDPVFTPAVLDELEAELRSGKIKWEDIHQGSVISDAIFEAVENGLRASQ